MGEAKSESTPSGLPRDETLHKSGESVRQHVQLPQYKESTQQVHSEAGGGAAAAKSDPVHCEKPEPPQGGALVGPAPAATRTKEAASPGAVSKAFGPSAAGAGSGIGPNQKSVLGPQGCGGMGIGPIGKSMGGAAPLGSVGAIGKSMSGAGGGMQQLGGRNRDFDQMMKMPSKPAARPGLGKPGGLSIPKSAPIPAAPPSNPKMHPGGNAASNQGFAVLKPGQADAMFAADRAKVQPAMSSLGKPGGLSIQKGTPMPASGGEGGFDLQMLKPGETPPVAGGGSSSGGSAMGRLTGAAKAVPNMAGKALSGVQGMLGLGHAATGRAKHAIPGGGSK